jgi:general secretion pathway protein F
MAMGSFRFSAIDPAGKWASGIMDGLDRGAILTRLNEMGHHPVEVVEAHTTRTTRKALSLFSGVVKYEDITSWCRELGWLLRAGVNLSDGLEILAAGNGAGRMGPACESIRSNIRKGQSLHTAMATSGVFPADIVSMVDVAEASGTLPSVLERIAQSREHMEKVRERITSALIYPALLVTIAITAVTFIMYYIVPTLKDVITGAGGPVPEAARFVIGISDWLIANGSVLLALVVFASITAAAAAQLRVVRDAGFTVATYIPILGGLIRNAAAIRFCRTLATLLEAGVGLTEGLRLMKSGAPSAEIRRILEDMESALRTGGDFVEPMSRSRIFPAVLSRMLRVGSETGNFTPSLLQATEMQQAQFSRSVERAMSLLEPVIILVLSFFVGSIIITLMSAVVSVNDLAI